MAALLKTGMKIIAPRKTGDTPLDYTYVVERIRRIPHTARIMVEVRSERQRCFDRLLTGYTSWDLAYMQECFKAGTMEVCA